MRNYSEEVAAEIDKHIRKFIDKAYKRTEEILKKQKALVEKISIDLIKKETLSDEEFKEYFKEAKVPEKII